MTPPYEIESEEWYRAVAEGRESPASDRPSTGMTFEEGMRARVEAQRSWSTAQDDFERRMREGTP